MTKPTGRPRGRPRKHSLPEEGAERAAVEERIAEVEAELERLEEPPATAMATDLREPSVAILDKHERRRSTLQRLLAGLKIQLLEMERNKHERELEPHLRAREEAGQEIQRIEERECELHEEKMRARAAWGDANTRALSKERRIKETQRQIQELRAERA